jgi:O-antigen ligase
VLVAGAVLAIAWGALAFGAVYPWAYRPLAVGCAVIGVAGLLFERRHGPSLAALGAGLTAIAAAAAVQLMPLGADTFVRLSPAGDAFLRSYDFAYQMAPGAHALSIAPDKTRLGLALFVAFSLFLLGMIRVVSSRGATAIARPLVLLGFVLAMFGILQAALLANKDSIVEQIYGFWRPRQGGNPFGPFVNRNHFAGWAIMVLPLSIASACAAWEHGKMAARDRITWLSTPRGAGMLLVAFAASVTGLALLMTQSRSGMTAFTAATGLFALVIVSRQATRGGKIVAALVIATLFVGATVWAGVGRIAQRLSSARTDAISTTGRLQAWSDALHIVRDFPVTGTGLNTFGTAMMVYQSGDRRLHYREAHNEYLQIATEGGLLIGIPVLLTVAIFARDVRRRFREAPKEGATYWLRVGAVVGILAVALQSLLDFSLQMPGNAALFALLGAIALHESPNARRAARR